MSKRPKNQLIDITFFKKTGKYYAETRAVVNHFIFEEGFKQDIVNTQDVMREGWQGDYIVVTSAPEHVNGFFEGIFFAEEFEGLTYKEVI